MDLECQGSDQKLRMESAKLETINSVESIRYLFFFSHAHLHGAASKTVLRNNSILAKCVQSTLRE